MSMDQNKPTTGIDMEGLRMDLQRILDTLNASGQGVLAADLLVDLQRLKRIESAATRIASSEGELLAECHLVPDASMQALREAIKPI